MNNNTPKQSTNADIAQALLATGAGNGSNNDMAELAAILKRRFVGEEKEIADRKAEAAKYREQQLAAINLSMQAQKEHQWSCSHMKENYKPNTNGQRDHQGHIHLVCSNCGKEFDEAELSKPEFRHLALPAERVGGPQQ